MNNTTIAHWYLITDGLILTCSAIGTIVSMVFVLTVTVSRQERHSLPNLIDCNTQLPIFLLSLVTVRSIVKVLRSDLYHFQIDDFLCVWRGYLVYSEFANIFYSFATQSYYRYVQVKYSARPHFSSMKTMFTIMILQWVIIHGMMLFLPLGNFIDFDIESQMCTVSLFSRSIIWLVTGFVYLPPCKIIAFVYIRLAILSRDSRIRAANVIVNNSHRELQLIKGMLLVLSIFAISGVPYSIFAILALFKKNLLPVYYYRIITCFNAVALAIGSNIIFWQNMSVRKTIIHFLLQKNNQHIHPQCIARFRARI